ncbi:MAG TPA: DUF1127 domain-containing protein [Aestuariivirgaceae bacterium]|nr:DUF1127 domain-containing protein [Aestuariivirgaceae bacterium]
MKPLIAARTMAIIDARETAVDSIVQIMSRAMASLSENMRTRRLRNDLRKLDNHMLNDIGLTRFDVEFGRLTSLPVKTLSDSD